MTTTHSGREPGVHLLRHDRPGVTNRPLRVLVALAFHGPRPEGHEAVIRNGDPWDCSPDNVDWKTKREHLKDAARAGRFVSGEKQG